MTDKALVLGGGGVTGIAWEIGIIAGLAEHGIDLTQADLVVGTSAGSVVGVDVRSGLSLADLYQTQIAPVRDSEVVARMAWPILLRYFIAMTFTRDPVLALRRVGKLALTARTEPEAVRRKVFEDGIPITEWPAGQLQVTAVDTATGDFAVFDAASGVGLIDAVGASCAVPGIWPPVTIGGKRYMDGGMRSAANIDLASGYRRVVVIAPLTAGFGVIPSAASQMRQLSGQASSVVLIKPDRAALAAIGLNVLDPARRAAAAKAGFAQAAIAAAAVAAVWSADQADTADTADQAQPVAQPD
jgi:NTE family protein